MVVSHPAEAIRRPSGLNATLRHQLVCPRRLSTSRPLAASQRRTVLSSPTEARRKPSGLKALRESREMFLSLWRDYETVLDNA